MSGQTRRGLGTSYKEKWQSARQMANHLSDIAQQTGNAFAEANDQVQRSRGSLTSSLSEVLGESYLFLSDPWLDATTKAQFAQAIGGNRGPIPFDRTALMASDVIKALLQIACNQRETIEMLAGISQDVINAAEANLAVYNRTFDDREIFAEGVTDLAAELRGGSISAIEGRTEQAAEAAERLERFSTPRNEGDGSVITAVPASVSSSINELIRATEGEEM